ncbi:hypothetical protein [Bosea sp. RAC05]|uniref:hypothetical protein n=1 Tax=Bosea sp. RAC05 TaxID=1842539 RepID=UPI00083D5A66|nr:hypothetical protein [Bosea sp. RAC05]AOG02777.1 hypothetical protein BSY19_4697 [Bosea sp. RAC05]
MHDYYLVDDGQSMPRWCELAIDDAGPRWIDFKGRRRAFGEGKAIAHVAGSNIHATLDAPADIVAIERAAAFRFLLDPWSDQGWLNPAGRFYGCAFYAHDDIAYALLRMSPGTLEQKGWIRVHTDSFRMGMVAITRRQEDTLFALGFENPEPGTRRTHRHEPARDQPAPIFAVKPAADDIERPAPASIQIVIHNVRSEAAPLAEPPRRPEPQPDHKLVALRHLANRLAQVDELKAMFENAPEHVHDVGPGTWLWMLRFEELTFGGEEHPADVVGSKGLYLRATSFDTIEVAEWPFDEVKIEESAAKLIGRQSAMAPAF